MSEMVLLNDMLHKELNFFSFLSKNNGKERYLERYLKGK